MTNDNFERLQGRIGESRLTVEAFHIERGKVAEFVKAIGEDDAVFRDRTVAENKGFERIPVPPTFTRTAMFPRYRPQGIGRLGFDLGFDDRFRVHGEQTYDFERPLFVGDTLSGVTTLMDVYRRDGSRGGTMTFAELETVYRDARDEKVLTARSTAIETDGAVNGGGEL